MKKRMLIIVLAFLFVVGVAGVALVEKRRQVSRDVPLAPLPTMTDESALPQPQEEEVAGTSVSQITTTTTPTVYKQITLTITSPANASTVTQANITVSGKTTPKAEVFVNDKQTVADGQGNFSVGITLDEGDNPIIVVTNDAEGNFAEKEIVVNYNP